MKGAIVALSFAAVAAAIPQNGYYTLTRVTTKVTTKATTTSCGLTICADYINSCGMGYGGCYPACPGLPTPTFTPPPCPTTTKKTTTTTTCRTICVDAINECGIRYGGCYCSGGPPNYTKPPCPSTTTTKPPTTTCRTICVDAVNECGIKYGGCYCAGGPPNYTKPPCPTTTAAPTSTSGPKKCGGLQGLQCAKGETCIDDPKSPCGIAVDCLGICIVEQFCGGFAGIQCKAKTDVCIDDPRDDCDPKNGGADCGGLCIPSSWAK
ncbi:hypothetical protein H072_1205 [Dactylellina haptotyla CBS 200.50]|uniref:Uncharacterized protein n=1 Tax=Dactylellina haptotyla (strain CBS 200.50) TaxID=1284197 RepID=S8CAP8_DACHA|nr:hypothetical protein H072_1205 [Dactylellina haptotyla CBS 200.50]